VAIRTEQIGRIAFLEIHLPDLTKLDVPEIVRSYPTMMTPQEKALLYWLAANIYTGSGIIVDAGIFLGASTIALATGLKDNSLSRYPTAKPIQSYDLAIWVASMDRYLENANVQKVLGDASLQPGDSFEPVLKRVLEPYSDLVELNIGNIIDTARSDHPVEIAFYDCLKSDDRDLAVFRAFAPSYIPGTTIVLQQDYFYESAAPNKIRQEHFSDYFEFIGQVANTAVFRCLANLPDAALRGDPVAELSLATKVDLLERAALRAGDNKTRILTRLSIVEFLIEHGEAALAAQRLERVEAEMGQCSLAEITRRPENIARGFWRRIQEVA
jgi:hypothetical protein